MLVDALPTTMTNVFSRNLLMVALLSITATAHADLAPEVLPSTVIEFNTWHNFGDGILYVETVFGGGGYTDIIRQGGRMGSWYNGGEGSYVYEKTGPDTARLTFTGGHPVSLWQLTFTEADRGNAVSGDTWAPGRFYSGTFMKFDRTPVPLTNLSNRTRVAANGVSISGFVVAGSVPRQVLIRVLGPSLANYGVSDYLPNPQLTVYDHTGFALSSNLSWQDQHWGAFAERIRRVSAMVAAAPVPAGSPEPADFLTLEPGAYTIHAQSEVDGDQGEVLTEVYFFR